jgi:hypothetical protein
MERHAHTLHTALARRGHQVHVFTSPSEDETATTASISSKGSPFHLTFIITKASQVSGVTTKHGNFFSKKTKETNLLMLFIQKV